MKRLAHLPRTWIRFATRTLLVVSLVSVFALALACDLRHRAVRDLARAENDFVAAIGPDTVVRVRASLSRPAEGGRRLVEAALSAKLTAADRKRLTRLATSNAPPSVLAPWRPPCEEALALMDRARHLTELAPDGVWGPPPASQAMVAIGNAFACGLAAAAQGDRPAAIVAVELLGDLARSLEARPLRLSLMVGHAAERDQLQLVERLLAGADTAERSLLAASLSGEDLRARHRDALAGEMVQLSTGWQEFVRGHDPWPVLWYLGPFVTGAHLRDLTRFAQNDPRPPAWPDSEFVGPSGQRLQLERERAALAERSLQREALRRELVAARAARPSAEQDRQEDHEQQQ
jgi:hypothetical protein